MPKEKVIKTRISDEEVQEYIDIAKDCGVTKSDLVNGIFKTLKSEIANINNSEKRVKIKKDLQSKCKKIKEEKGYLSFTDLFKSIGSTFKNGCDDISNDMNIATKKKAINLQNTEVKKDSKQCSDLKSKTKI